MSDPERADSKHWRAARRDRRSSSERASALSYASPPILSHYQAPPASLPTPVGLDVISPSENDVFTPASYVPSPTPTLENYLGWQRTSFSAGGAVGTSEPLWNQIQYRSTLSRSLAGDVDQILDNHGSQLDPPEGFGNDPTWSPKLRGDQANKEHYASAADDRKCTCGQRMRLSAGARLNSAHTSRNSLDDILHPRVPAEDMARHATPVHAYGTISRSYRRHAYDKPRIDHALLDYNAQEQRLYSDPRTRVNDDLLRGQYPQFQERDTYSTPSHSVGHQSQRERARQLPVVDLNVRAVTLRSEVTMKAIAPRTPCPCLLAAVSVVKQDDKNPSVYAHVEGCPHCGGTHTTKLNSEWPASVSNPPAQSASELVPYKPQLSSSNSSSGSEVGGSQTFRSENIASSKQSLLPVQHRRIETSSVYSSLPRSRMTSLSTVPLSDTESRAEVTAPVAQPGPARALQQSSRTATSSSRKPIEESQTTRTKGQFIANVVSEAKKAIGKKSSMFLGVERTTENDQLNKWEDRRRRYAERKGKLKTSEVAHVVGGSGDTVDGTSVVDNLPLIPSAYRKESVAGMTWNGISRIGKSVKARFHKEEHAPVVISGRSSRSIQQSTLPNVKDHRISVGTTREVFFDKSPPLPLPKPEDKLGESSLEEVEEVKRLVSTESGQPPSSRGTKRDEVDSRTRRKRGRWGAVLNQVVDNSDRRQYGVGVVGRWFGGRSIRGSVKHQDTVRHQLEAFEDYRPYFTYWVTTVQVVVLVTAIFLYGFAPFGIGIRQRTGKVMVKSLSLETVDYFEPQNLWLGPRVASLVHLGAKFAPCMKSDTRIKQRLLDAREQEKSTACCIRNDNSGCIQATRSECSPLFSSYQKWASSKTGPGGRISGSVCGQDPSFCREPASIAPYEWPDDITKWPKCRKRLSSAVTSHMEIRKDNVNHMNCELIGRPCCIGILGECKILTREHCVFLNGRFHSDATLCSQVDCMGDVCGMIPFLNPDYPDQFYRVFISFFIHAGIIHLLLSVAFQFIIMRDLERLSGPLRVGLIYFGSGITGNLASAIFIPNKAEVGPAGAQFGILAAHLVEVIHAWHLYKRPWQAIRLPLLTILALFILGLVPMIDNYAHFFGFLSGFLLSFSLLPFISIGDYERKIKVSLIIVSLLLYVGLLALLIIGFYIWPIENDTVLKFFGYFNCVPITDDFCAEQNIHWTPKLFIL